MDRICTVGNGAAGRPYLGRAQSATFCSQFDRNMDVAKPDDDDFAQDALKEEGFLQHTDRSSASGAERVEGSSFGSQIDGEIDPMNLSEDNFEQKALNERRVSQNEDRSSALGSEEAQTRQKEKKTMGNAS